MTRFRMRWRRLSGWGRESGLFVTYIRTDTQLVTKDKVYGKGGMLRRRGTRGVNSKNLDYFDAVSFMG